MTGETFATEQEANDYIFRIITPYKKAYPAEVRVDLTRPSNFVKLLNLLLLNNYSLEFDANELAETFLIDTVINMIKYDNNCRVISLAQQTEWEY